MPGCNGPRRAQTQDMGNEEASGKAAARNGATWKEIEIELEGVLWLPAQKRSLAKVLYIILTGGKGQGHRYIPADERDPS